MTAVIGYSTPYFINKREPLLISFALSNEVFLRCVLGFSTLFVLGGFIDLLKGEFVCFEINRTFPLTSDPPDKRLPEVIVFDNSTLSIPQGLSTNVNTNPSLLHYTSTEGRALHPSSPSYSENIIVHYNFFEGTKIVHSIMILVKNVSGQVFKSAITNNKIEQKCMKSPSVITTNTKESFTNLSSATDQVSNCSIIESITEQKLHDITFRNYNKYQCIIY